MIKRPIQMHKKGASLMVAYVLLVVIAVGLSAIVFTYLKSVIPYKHQAPECHDNIALTVIDYSCNLTTNTLTATLENNGLFNITGAYLRMAPSGQTVRSAIGSDALTLFLNPLSPGKTYLFKATLTSANLGDKNGKNYDLEVEPSVLTNAGVPAACNTATIVQPITCI